MSQEHNRRIAQQLLAGIGAGTDPDEIAALFSVDVQFEIQGDVGALPWIGQKTGRSAAADFIRDTRRLIEQLRFDWSKTSWRATTGQSSSVNSARGSMRPERSSSQPLRSS